MKIYYKLSKNDRNECLKILFNMTKNKRYDDIYEVLENLKNCSDESNIHVYHTYAYLLSFIVDSPYELDDYLEMPKDLNFKGMTTNGYKICQCIKRGQYESALIDSCKNKKEGIIDFERDIFNILLSDVISNEKKLLELIENKEYEKLVDILLKRQSVRKLTELEEMIFILVDAIIKTLKGEIIQPMRDSRYTHKYHRNYKSYSLYELILRNEFKLAFYVSKSNTWYMKNVEKIKFVNFTLEEKAILFLLEQLNFLTRNNIKTIEDIEFQSKYLLDKNINFAAASAGVEIINLIKLVQAIRSYESGLIEYGDILVKYVSEATYYNFEEKKEMSLATPSIEVFKEKAKEARAKAIQIYTVDGVLMPPKQNFNLLLKERRRGR